MDLVSIFDETINLISDIDILFEAGIRQPVQWALALFHLFIILMHSLHETAAKNNDNQSDSPSDEAESPVNHEHNEKDAKEADRALKDLGSIDVAMVV